MALPSQMARTTEMSRNVGGFSGGSRRRRLKKLAVPVALIAVAGGLLSVWWVMRDKGGGDTDGATPSAAVANRSRGEDRGSDAGRDPLEATFAALPNASAPGRSGAANTPPAGNANTAPVQDASTAAAVPPTQVEPQAPLSVIEMGAKPGQGVSATPAPGPGSVTPGTTPAQPEQSGPAGGSGGDGTTPTQSAPAQEQTGSPIVLSAMSEVDRLIAQNKPVEARLVLSRAIGAPGASSAELEALRARAGSLTDRLLFSPVATPGDPMTEVYAVASGDSLVKIASVRKTNADWRLIQRVNGITDPGRLRVGQKLKLVKGPFHAVVTKSAYRLDLYADVSDGSSAGSQRVYLKSFRVGLGENDSTPTGNFVVRPSSKLINPTWSNPRTGEFFAADNPKNPIGEHWIGLDPADEATRAHTQYGLHGTIEPESIGQQKSMGCVRLGANDIALLYELLIDKMSTVKIVP
ncbi:MAG: L,D-transpeptidase family protein [Phycisphaerales bacterium]